MAKLSNPCMAIGKTIAFDCMDLCQQSDVSAVSPCHSFSSKEQMSVNVMNACGYTAPLVEETIFDPL